MPMAPESELKAAPESTQAKDNWDEIKADIKQLVKELRSLTQQPQPEPEPEPGKRKPPILDQCNKDDGWADGWLHQFRPTSQKQQTVVDVLLSMFIKDKDKDKDRHAEELPSFADKLTLQLFEGVEVTRSKMSPKSEAELREHVSSPTLWAPNEVPKGSDVLFFWKVPSDGEFRVLFDDRYSDNPDHDRQDHYHQDHDAQDQMRWLKVDPLTLPNVQEIISGVSKAKGQGCGALCQMRVPLKDGILEFRWIEFILAQMCLVNTTAAIGEKLSERCYAAQLSSVMYFLGVFAGQRPSRNERYNFSHKADFDRWLWRYHIQVHFRFFVPVESLKASPGTEGLKCLREHIQITSDAPKVLPLLFQERRISIFGVLSSGVKNYNAYNKLSVRAFYRVLVLAEAGMVFPFELTDVDASRLKLCKDLEGTIAFHAAVFVSVRPWETNWTNVLDQIDECLRFEVKKDLKPKEIKKWMFDDDFGRSKLYFTILQILRIFGEYIRTMAADLHQLDDLFVGVTQGFPLPYMKPDEISIMRSNWESVLKVQKDAEKRLLDRLLDKTEEVKSLRDGLFNASSLREASRATTMNRYVIIFTVVTVLYLPPSFISTVFGMAIFQKDNTAKTTWEYKVTTVSVSLVTYLVAIASIIAVNWNHAKLKQKCVQWWQRLASHYRSTPGANARPAPVTPERKPEEVGNLAGSTSGAKDPENVVDEDVGKAVKRRFPWFTLPRDSASRQAKGKEPDRGPPLTYGKLDV